MSKRLDADTWANVVRHAPLISFDLVVVRLGKVLLGLRKNQPAREKWFVPGGVIRKGESMVEAFARVTTDELGAAFSLVRSRLLGVYEHFYDTNFREEPGFGTHYVVLARRLHVQDELQLPEHQHSHYRWFDEAELIADPQVHCHVKRYFDDVG